MVDQVKPSKAFEETKALLPKELHEPFEWIVKDYMFHCLVVHNSRMYAPKVLAELVKAGWRRSADQK